MNPVKESSRIALVVHPFHYEKHEAYQEARELCDSFLERNELPQPKRYLTTPDDSRRPPGRNPWSVNGWYWNDTIFVNVKRSKTPVKTPGFAWSYTGFKADMTAPGILAHELGHYVKDIIDQKIDRKHRAVFRKNIQAISEVEPNVSSYEPNADERWAEAFRLFVLNPDLLRVGRPVRYDFFLHLRLRPVNPLPWREVLANAHPKLIKAAESWIKKAQ